MEPHLDHVLVIGVVCWTPIARADPPAEVRFCEAELIPDCDSADGEATVTNPSSSRFYRVGVGGVASRSGGSAICKSSHVACTCPGIDKNPVMACPDDATRLSALTTVHHQRRSSMRVQEPQDQELSPRQPVGRGESVVYFRQTLPGCRLLPPRAGGAVQDGRARRCGFDRASSDHSFLS